MQLNWTKAAKQGGWTFERAGHKYEKTGTDVVGWHPDGREYYVSIKTDGAFSEKSIQETRDIRGDTLPDIYVNEFLQARKTGNLSEVIKLK